MSRLALPFCVAFGMSLFHPFTRLTIPGVAFSLAVSDIVIAGLVLYTLLCLRRARWSLVVPAVLFLAVALLLSGAVNGLTNPMFDGSGFLVNYVRVIALVFMVILCPSWARWMGPGPLAQGTLWTVRLHSVLVVADSFGELPIRFVGQGLVWSLNYPDTASPQGLFGESSFVGVYIGLALIYILQVERNTGVRHLRMVDVGLASLALVVSNSVSSIGMLVLFVGILILRGNARQRHKAVGGIALVAVLLIFSVQLELGPARWLDNIRGRVLASIPIAGQFTDGSGRARIIGSSLTLFEVLRDSPIVGKGLGGSNTLQAMTDYGRFDRRRSETLFATTMTSAIVLGGGLLGLLPLVFVYGWALASPQTRLIGLGLFLVGWMWAGVFEPVFWWWICLAVALKQGRTTTVIRVPPRQRAFTEATTGAV